MHNNEMRRTMGITGTVMTLVGLVIGVSIFILPGQLAAMAGPAMLVSYLIAAAIALFSCIVAAQVGSVLPMTGASFIAISKLLSPFAGFVVIWLTFGGAAVAVALLASGFADYAVAVMPFLDEDWLAFGLVGSLGVLNLMGLRGFVVGQTLLVAIFMVALLVFVVSGLLQLDTSLLTPFAPNGSSAVLAAVIPAFFSYTGFMLIIEISGEIRSPGRTIPIALGLSFLIVLVVYSLVSLVLVGLMPWQQLGSTSTPIADVARLILPGWVASAIAFTAVAAAATSVNAILLAYSRDVLALARARLFPVAFARVSRRQGEPVYGVIFITVLSLLAVLAQRSVTQYASMIVMGVMTLHILVSIAVLRMPSVIPELFQASAFQLGSFARWFFCIGLMASSGYFLWYGLSGDGATAQVVGVYVAVGCTYYGLRGLFVRGQAATAREHIDDEIERMRRSAEDSTQEI